MLFLTPQRYIIINGNQNSGAIQAQRLVLTSGKTEITLSLGHSFHRSKGKCNSRDIAPLTVLDISALQPQKWQLIGISCSTAAQGSGSP